MDVRIIVATNRDLRAMVAAGQFREDLFYRLSVFPIFIPPLRQRPQDIEALTRHFLGLYNAKYGKAVDISRNGLEVMAGYSWPGNARELQNVVERLLLISSAEAIIGAEQMMALLNLGGDGAGYLRLDHGLKAIIDDLERRTIELALGRCGTTRKAAALLKVDQSTIVKKAKRLGIRIVDGNMSSNRCQSSSATRWPILTIWRLAPWRFSETLIGLARWGSLTIQSTRCKTASTGANAGK